MLRHEDVWRAIDRLAKEHGLSASGLARRAGLDPTTFNRSKRATRDGRLRWPSTESIAKILSATGAGLPEFISYIGKGGGVFRNLPVVALSKAGAEERFDATGRVVAKNWDEISFPNLTDLQAFALEVDDGDLAPVFRLGDILVVSPVADPRRGDRVVFKSRDGAVSVAVLKRRSARRVEFETLGTPSEERALALEDVQWMARVVWASQ
jgi:phage repressor protein C with HTH and peptisase S24 domain